MRFFADSRRALLILAAAAILLPQRLAHAQDSSAAPTHPTPNECFRFAFGAWSTPLDWRTAGHRGATQPSDSAEPRGDASRSGTDKLGDIVLYPSWWPVGVYVDLDTTRTQGDTLLGTATAFVANGNVAVPTAPVRAWRVLCGLAAEPRPQQLKRGQRAARRPSPPLP